MHFVKTPDLADYLTTAEVAEALGRARSTITRWVDQGRIPPPDVVVPGRRGAWLWSPDAVERLSERAAQPP